MANWQGLLAGAGNFANGVSGLLFPGYNAAGVDPNAVRAARAQAMMQMGAGLLGGANAGQAYGAGLQAGFEPMEQYRRNAVMQSDAAWRQMQADEILRRRQAEEASAAQAAELKALVGPMIQSGDYEGARRALAANLQFGAAKDVGSLIPGSDETKIGAYNPGDYTPESFAAFIATGKKDPSVLRRQYAPQQPPAPVVIQAPGYGTALIDRRTGQPIQQYTTGEQEQAAAAQQAVAKEQATANVQAAQNAKAHQAAWDMYQQARAGLNSALQGTSTGPVMGRIPAVTAPQQTAEGAVAAMAPILKQIFRVAGEGTFTDRDQALLLDMVPKRTDLSEARDAKLANIDAIIAAKLQQPQAQAPARSSRSAPMKGQVVRGYRFKGGDPSNPANWEKAQ